MIKHNAFPTQLKSVYSIQAGGCLDSSALSAAPRSHVALHLSRQKLSRSLPSIRVCISVVRLTEGWSVGGSSGDRLRPSLCKAGSSRASSPCTACIPVTSCVLVISEGT